MLTVAPETATGELPDVREEPGTGRRRWLDRFAPVVYLLGGIYLVGRRLYQVAWACQSRVPL